MAYTPKVWADGAAGNTPITAAELNRMEGGIAVNSGAEQRLDLPLAIPTGDANPSVGHPDVLFIPEGWNGYRYWMAFTPYPPADRENIHIAASHDGVKWEIPAGLTNPIFTLAQAQALGHNHNSDPDLVLLSNGDMAIYHRPASSGGGERIMRQTSSNGVTWSTATSVVFSAGTIADHMSPAVVIEPNGTFTMWTVRDASGTRTVQRRTSPDGLTWSAPSNCTVPTGPSPWHVDVVRVGGVYHMLLASNSPFRLYYWTSADGVTWTGSTRPIPLTGLPFDAQGHYRSTFVATAGHPLAFDIWVTGIDNSNANVFAAVWRIGLLRNYDPSQQTFQRSDQRYTRKDQDAYYLSANMLRAGSGTPTESVLSFRFPIWSFAAGAFNSVTTSFLPPESWRFDGAWPRVRVSIYWTQDATDTPSGNVAWRLLYGTAKPGQLTTLPATDSAIVTAVAPTRRAVVHTTLLTLVAVEPGGLLVINPRRLGNDAANDTFAGSVALLGVLIEAMEP